MISFLRVLAVAPSVDSFGYALIEQPGILIDWCVKTTKSDKNVRCVSLVKELIDYYKPDILILEDWKAKRSRRHPRIQSLLQNLSKVAADNKIKTVRVSRDVVRKVFSLSGNITKHQIATNIVSRFPELAPHLPPIRKPWMKEDYWMSVFDAMALVLTYFHSVRSGMDR